MSLGQKYARILTALLPTGMVGVTMLLGSAAPAIGSAGTENTMSSAPEAAPASDRLSAIRDVVSAMSLSPPRAGATLGEGQELAWSNWGNVVLPLPLPVAPWNNWNNWNNWQNNWNNWHNWPNWHNWNNYWHNW